MSSEKWYQSSIDYQRIEETIHFLENNFHRQPSLAEIAASVHLSEFHFQRLFSRWVGISPKRFLQYLTKEHAKQLLQKAPNILDVTYASGLSSPGRLHELFVTCEAMTPGEYKNQGEGLVISYGFHPTPFGECLIATTARGICALNFVKADRAAESKRLQKKWKNATLTENPRKTEGLVDSIFGQLNGKTGQPLHLFVRGTNFQIKVWEALLRIPSGYVVSYGDIAEHIGRPRAVRAVANAVARNPVAYIIPCHRVIRSMGDFGGYQGGTSRKKALLGWESAKSAAPVG